MKTPMTTLHNGSRACEMAGPVFGRKLILSLLTRLLLWAAVFVLPAFGAEAAVVLTTLYSFTGSNDGAYPTAALVQGSDGNFYGTTSGFDLNSGQQNGLGTVFRISPSGTLATLYAFGSITNASGDALDGENPCAALVQGSDGNFYGTTAYGGTNGVGTVFKMSTNGALTNLYSFGSVQETNGNLLDGEWPMAGLVQGSDGNFYGTTEQGGTYDLGTVFKISTNGTPTSLYSFGTQGPSFYPQDGADPVAGLVQGSDGNFHGTTGGVLPHWFFEPTSYGTVFKITTNGALTALYAFDSITNASGEALDGENPQAGLVQGSDGFFYGTTEHNATELGWPVFVGPGTAFRISTNGALTTLYTFGSITNPSGDALDGENPCAALVQGSDGSFYGTTGGGGAYTNQYGQGFGTVFRLTIVPEFQAVTLLTNNTLNLTWRAEAGGRYQLQCNSHLSSSNWTNLGSPFTATGATCCTTDCITNGPQRVMITP